MRRINNLLIVFLIAVVVMPACVANIMPAPESPQERIAFAQTAITGANESVVQMLVTGDITVEGAKEYRAKAYEAKLLLSVYKEAINQGDIATANAKWELLNSILIELQKYLYK